jgi:hypothetical protein
MPAANDWIRQQHQSTEAAIRRRICELDDSMNNLLRVLEREQDPDGQLYRRTKQRMFELDNELAAADAEPQHLASSGDQQRHRLSRAGNRRINRVLHIMAVVQLRHDTAGRAYYRRPPRRGQNPRWKLSAP